MTDVSIDNKKIAQAILKSFGGKPTISNYFDDTKEYSVDLFESINQPYDGITSYSTIGLSDTSLFQDNESNNIGLEIVGACSNSIDYFANIITTAAFCIIKSNYNCFPGCVFTDIVAMYDPSSPLKHLFFVSPFLWEPALDTLELETKKVAWLLAVPISEKEYNFLENEGSDKLESLFEEKQIDIFDINRPSII